MNDSTIGRNYAETLLILAKKQGQQEEWGALIDAIAVAMQENRTLKTFLESPKLAASQKIEILHKALGKRVPPISKVGCRSGVAASPRVRARERFRRRS